MIRKLKRGNVLIAVLSLVASSNCSLFTSPPVNASSVYDNDYQTTNNLVTSATGSYPCNTVDSTLTWAKYITDPGTWPDPSAASNPSSAYSVTRASYLDALQNGTWGVSQGYQYASGYKVKFIRVFWTNDTDSEVNWFGGGTVKFQDGNSTTHHLDLWCKNAYWGNGGDQPMTSGAMTNAGYTIISNNVSDEFVDENEGAVSIKNLFVSGASINYPDNYAGVLVSTGSTDGDGDGLSEAQEMTQGTSDTDSDGDTDGDGISDLKESVWYPDRDEIFCGSSECAYPDPAKKDLYVEVDWMKESGLFGRSFKPSATQLDYAIDAYAAKGINAHFDTGQYGGGNELPTYTQNLHFEKDSSNFDFYDYKNGTPTTLANFDSSRYHIWHYMITGYEYADIVGSSGVSYFSDDDTFISSGLVEDNPGNDFTYSNIDYAIAGTILHELGHNLCLNSKTTTLRSECYSSYIDTNSAPSNYNSVMNYSYQMSNLLDYSSGANGSSDHDDWSAVGLGLADFVSRNQGDQTSAGKSGLRVGISRSQAKQLRKEHRIFSHVDESKRSLERRLFDQKRTLINR